MLRLACMNLMVVAFLGLVMRLKISISIPWLNQKFLLNGHSHFAFIGWVGFVGICFAYYLIFKEKEIPPIHWRFLRTYLINSWLMLTAFLLSGYSPVSMALLFVHIGLSVWFAVWWRKNRGLVSNQVARWSLNLANAFNLISFLGPLILAVMVIFQTGSAYTKQNAIYMFLHYQYNGYFLFTCMALVALFSGAESDTRKMRNGIVTYAIAVALGIGLLMLVREKPLWLIASNYVAGSILLLAFYWLLPEFVRVYRSLRPALGVTVRILWSLAFAGLVVKILLQAFSAIPAIGYMVYEHRSIAIGYLHLVFLVVVTFFFLGLILHFLQAANKSVKIGITLFVTGVVLNEALLGIQGLGAILSLLVPYTNELLVVVSAMMFLGLTILFSAIYSNKNTKLKTHDNK